VNVFSVRKGPEEEVTNCGIYLPASKEFTHKGYCPVQMWISNCLQFNRLPTDRKRGNGQKLKHVKFHVNRKENRKEKTKHSTSFSFSFCFCESSQTLEQPAQRGRGVSIFGDIQKLPGHSPGKPALGDLV